jgi:hypothetical protein
MDRDARGTLIESYWEREKSPLVDINLFSQLCKASFRCKVAVQDDV